MAKTPRRVRKARKLAKLAVPDYEQMALVEEAKAHAAGLASFRELADAAITRKELAALLRARYTHARGQEMIDRMNAWSRAEHEAGYPSLVGSRAIPAKDVPALLEANSGKLVEG